MKEISEVFRSLPKGEGRSGEESIPPPDKYLPAVDRALNRLAAVKPRAAEIVNLRFFEGMTYTQVSEDRRVMRFSGHYPERRRRCM